MIWETTGRGQAGYDVLLWIEQEVVLRNYAPPRNIQVHSANPAARQWMLAVIDSIRMEFIKKRNMQEK